MALVGHISGSLQSNSVIGVSGTVIFADRNDALFPSFPGSDVSFFVSGSIGGKGGPIRAVSVFGGDAHISGSLTVGTGSVFIHSNGVKVPTTGIVSFGSDTSRIEVVGGNLTLFDAANPAGKTISSIGGATAVGGTGAIQYADGTNLDGEAAFAYNESTNTMTVDNIVGNAAVSTIGLYDSIATTINFGGAAQAVNLGKETAGDVTALFVGGATNSGAGGNSSVAAATGSFARVLASSTSTFTGAATFSSTATFTGASTHNGGISTTTLNASSAASFLSTVSATGNITGQGTGNSLNALSVTGSLGLSVTSGATVGGATTLNGNVTLGDTSADTITYNGLVGSNVVPSSDRAFNLGSPTARWNNIYTGDLHLRNERGNWTVIEEVDYLSIRNNHTGKMYKFVLEEVQSSADGSGSSE